MSRVYCSRTFTAWYDQQNYDRCRFILHPDLHLTGRRSYALCIPSVPGINQAFVCPTQNSSMKRRSNIFPIIKIAVICQNALQKSDAPLIQYTIMGTKINIGTNNPIPESAHRFFNSFSVIYPNSTTRFFTSSS